MGRLRVWYCSIAYIIICNLDFDVRVGTINRGGQTRRRTVPDCRQADRLATGIGDHFFVVPVATAAVQPQRSAENPDGRVLDDHPRTPDHGQCQHFQRLNRRYGHHVVSTSDKHGHRADSTAVDSTESVVIHLRRFRIYREASPQCLYSYSLSVGIEIVTIEAKNHKTKLPRLRLKIYTIEARGYTITIYFQ